MQTSRKGLILLPVRPATATAASPQDKAEIQIYKPFFLSGIATVLTVGCLLGALALLGISKQGNYIGSTWTPYILAHANSQLFGWVGFFVMGFALQQHGTAVAKKGQFLKLSYASLGLMGLGIVLRFLAEPLAQMDPSRWVWIGVLSGLLQLVAVILFSYNSGANRYRTGEPLTWSSLFVFGSLGCLLIVSCLEPYVFAMTHQVEPMDSIGFIVRWMSPLRETQFLGFVAMMIFGVASSKFPGCLGFRKAQASWGIVAFCLWTGGLVARIIGWIRYFDSGFTLGGDSLLRIGGLLLFLAACSMAACLGVFERGREQNASQKFLRSAFAWLLIAGLLLVLEPLHLRAIGQPFSHAYTGGIRHAVTVGFISQMIIGVGYHLVTRMTGIRSEALPQLWSVFVLLNIGNLGRVALEILTDYTGTAFAPMGWTGMIELVGLSIWAATMIRFMTRKVLFHVASC